MTKNDVKLKLSKCIIYYNWQYVKIDTLQFTANKDLIEIWSLLMITVLEQTRFYHRVSIPLKSTLQLAECASTLLWLDEILELRKGLIIWVA